MTKSRLLRTKWWAILLSLAVAGFVGLVVSAVSTVVPETEGHLRDQSLLALSAAGLVIDVELDTNDQVVTNRYQTVVIPPAEASASRPCWPGLSVPTGRITSSSVKPSTPSSVRAA